MQGYVHNAVFGIYPYIAIAVFLIGIIQGRRTG